MPRRLRVRWEVTEVFEATLDPDALGIELPEDQEVDENEADFDTDRLAEFEGNEDSNYEHTSERGVLEFEWIEEDVT